MIPPVDRFKAPCPVSLLDALGEAGGKWGETTVMIRNLPNNYSRNMAWHPAAADFEVIKQEFRT